MMLPTLVNDMLMPFKKALILLAHLGQKGL
jgi:hypothetical protein